ncbi:hypothetical protein B0O99DRAFT_607931 [Bisporella sp. PMI_857]|nr:hypothetical protein B0O99DRAFT_607931 [Bisporella sp. PMI_857]
MENFLTILILLYILPYTTFSSPIPPQHPAPAPIADPDLKLSPQSTTELPTRTSEETPNGSLVKRTGTVPSPPAGAVIKNVLVDCIRFDENGNLEDICNIDCYIHLCLERSTLMKYNQEDSIQGVHRTESGFGIHPFTGVQVRLDGYGVTRFGPQYQSPEEWPPASSAQGGSGLVGSGDGDPIDYRHQALLAGVMSRGQTRQGTALNSAYTKATLHDGTISPLRNGEWFDVSFRSNADYCRALARWKSGDMHIEEKEEKCKKDNKGPKDPVNRVFVKTTPKGDRKPKFEPAIRGEGKFGYFKGVSKRDEEDVNKKEEVGQ